jgi:DNA-directed RNA polymerase beta subunit
MADNFLKQGDTSEVSGTDITINNTKAPSFGTSFLSTFAQGLMKGGGAESKLKKEQDKLTYYTSLREAGYSAEEATKQFSGSFLDRALGKDSAGFEKPSEDNFVSKNAKTNAEIAALKSKAARDDRYTGTDANKDRMNATMNQLQTRLKYLTEDIASSDDPQTQEEIKAITKMIRAVTLKKNAAGSEWGNPDDIDDLGESDQPDGTKALNKATNKRIVTENGRWRNA